MRQGSSSTIYNQVQEISSQQQTETARTMHNDQGVGFSVRSPNEGRQFDTHEHKQWPDAQLLI